MSPVESNPKERIYEVNSGVDLANGILVVRYVWHTLRASSEEALCFFNRVEPRIYFVSKLETKFFYILENYCFASLVKSPKVLYIKKI